MPVCRYGDVNDLRLAVVDAGEASSRRVGVRPRAGDGRVPYAATVAVGTPLTVLEDMYTDPPPPTPPPLPPPPPPPPRDVDATDDGARPAEATDADEPGR